MMGDRKETERVCSGLVNHYGEVRCIAWSDGTFEMWLDDWDGGEGVSVSEAFFNAFKAEFGGMVQDA